MLHTVNRAPHTLIEFRIHRKNTFATLIKLHKLNYYTQIAKSDLLNWLFSLKLIMADQISNLRPASKNAFQNLIEIKLLSILSATHKYHTMHAIRKLYTLYIYCVFVWLSSICLTVLRWKMNVWLASHKLWRVDFVFVVAYQFTVLTSDSYWYCLCNAIVDEHINTTISNKHVTEHIQKIATATATITT